MLRRMTRVATSDRTTEEESASARLHDDSVELTPEVVQDHAERVSFGAGLEEVEVGTAEHALEKRVIHVFRHLAAVVRDVETCASRVRDCPHLLLPWRSRTDESLREADREQDEKREEHRRLPQHPVDDDHQGAEERPDVEDGEQL